MSPILKSLLYAFLGVAAPMLYSLLLGKAPEFGNVMDGTTFGNLIFWLVGLPFGGWQLAKAAVVFSDSRSIVLFSLSFNPKEILYAVVAALIPFAYTAITGKFPTFPLDGNTFSTFIIWLIGLGVGGWGTFRYYAGKILKTYGKYVVSRKFVIT